MFCVLHLTFLLFSDTHAVLSADPFHSVFSDPVPASQILNGFICPEIKAHLPSGYDL